MSTSDSRESLYWACAQGNKHLVLNLVNRKNLNYVHPDHGDTPLHQACRQGWLDIVKLLIENYGCDLNVTNKYHQSPLDYAKQCGKIDVVRYLQGVSLYLACFRGHDEHLVFKSINPNNINYVHPVHGDSLLHQACKQGWLDVIKLLIETYGCDSNVTNNYCQRPLDYAENYGKIAVVTYLERTIFNNSLYWECAKGNKHLVLKLINLDNVNYVHPSFGDTPLHRACQQGWLDIVKLLIEKYGCDPNVISKHHESVLHYSCRYGHIDIVKYLIDKQHLNPLLRDNVDQSEPLDCALNNNQTAIAVYLCQHCISSDEILNPNRIKTTINLISYILRDTLRPFDQKWKTANGDNILQLVGSSKDCISHLPSVVVLKILDSRSNIKVKPDWKTSDGYNLLEVACQSEIFLSQTPSALILKWLGNTTINQVKKSIPDSKTADYDTLIQLVSQSEICISHISTAVLTKWLSDTTIIQNFITPEWKTANGDTLLQLVCQTKTIISRICSTVLTKWLSDAIDALDFKKIFITPELKTADGDTLLQLICQSENCLIHMSSTIFFKWLRKTPLEFVSISIPDCKTANGDTLLQLMLHSEMSISQTSSLVLSQLLSDSRDLPINQMKMVDPNWKTLDGIHFLNVLFHSKVEDIRIIELMQHYILKDGLNPDNTFLDNEGNTALHIACQVNKLTIVSYLIDQAHCDPNIKNKTGSLPLDMTTDPKVFDYLCRHDHVAVYSKTIVKWMDKLRSIDDATMLHIVKSLVDNHKYKTKDGSTLLHVVCTFTPTKIWLVDFLLSKCQCDPNCLDSKRYMSLQLTSDSEIMKMLVEHGAKMTKDVVFKLISSKHMTNSETIELFTLSVRKGTMIWNPSDLNDGSYTALQLACKLNKAAIVNYFLTETKCDPNQVINNTRGLLKSPLELTTNLEIAKQLIMNGAKVTPKLVIKFEAMEDSANKEVLLKLMLTTWNPDDRNSDGYTALHLACKTGNPNLGNLLLSVAHCDPNITGGSDGYTALHLACKAGNPTTVNLLLTVAHCDPNIKSNNGEVPLHMTTDTKIIKDLIRHGAKISTMYEFYHKSLGTNKPLQPPVKVFIVGNPSVGKSTLTAALKKKVSFIARIVSGKVSGVDRKTVGIVPHDIESELFGRVTLYDFAGQREFYSGHAALLQTAIQSTPPVFLLVVKVCEDSDEIIKTILYWISFLENQCASVSCKPHIILVGSHADALKGINPKEKIVTIIDSLNTEKHFTNMEYIGFVAMNCQYHKSAGMSNLRRLLIKSCEVLRILEPITFNAHCFLVFLIDTFMNQTAVTIKTISEKIENQQSKVDVLEFLPKDFEMLYKICLELNDRGHILLLKDRIAVENSYIVIDKEFLLSRLSGTVFAPEGFKQYKELSTNTGVVPLSKIAETFPNQDLNILIGFLTHLEFCHEISDHSLHQLISDQYSQVSGECYYLFPGLVSLKADDTVWHMQSNYDYYFGWVLKCNNLDQFFSSRFLQVLLLRLAFSFALDTSCDDPNQSIGIHRKCYLWKNGIFWGRTFAMQTLVEVAPDNKSVLLLARFQEDDILQCICHRSKVIDTILQCKEQFCSRVQTTELFLDSSSPHQYPIYLLNEPNICTLQDLATAVMSDTKSRRVVLQCATIPAKDFLSFEPYLEMKLSTIQDLCDETNEKKVVSESCLLRLVKQATDELRPFIKTITESSTNGISDDQIYQDLSRWRDSDKTKQKTYKDLRQLVDQYSIFAGRNVLELTSKQPKLLRPMDEEEQENEEKPQCKLTVQGDTPKLHELQLLKLADGTELIRIMEKVTPEWDEVAIALGFDGARIKTMKMGAYYQPGKACLEMFTDWLAGGHDLKPPTWGALIQCLRAAKLTEIADLLNRTIEIEAEDASASTLTTMAVDSESQVASSTATPDIINGNIKGPSIATVLNVKALEVMEGHRGRKVRIIDSIGSQWEEVAKALAMGQEDIDMIKTTHSDNDKEACREMLATWLESNNGEVSWTALSQALIDAGLLEPADLLKDALSMQL